MSNIENNNTCGSTCGCGTPTDGYWQDVENKVLSKKELTQEFDDNAFDSFSVQKTRRNFLKIMGFSVSALPLTGCIKIPVRKALPFINKQNDVIPGVANWYASTYQGTPILVKTREGRPIKVEGNDKSMVTFGGTGSHDQASVLSLYDSNRFRSAYVSGSAVEWDQFDSEMKKALSADGEIALVTSSLTSPSELALISELKNKYNLKHIAYDAVSQSAQYDANKITHGARVKSEYDFEKANVVVSIGADFLGTFGNHISNTKQYTRRRSAKHELGMNRHIQVEGIMSLTGSNADFRYTKSTIDQRDIILAVYAALGGPAHKVKSENKEVAAQIVKELRANAGKSLFLVGDNDVNAQVVANKINESLGNYGNTVMVSQSQGEVLASDEAFEDLVDRMNAGSVSAVMFVGVNPVYSFHNTAKLTKALTKVKTRVSFALSEDETSKACNFIAPANHAFESWSDTMVSSKEVSFTQPAIQPLFGTRMWSETLMKLLGKEGSFYDYMKGRWESRISWNKALHDGVVTLDNASVASATGVSGSSYAEALKKTKVGNGLNIVAYTKSAIGDGSHSNNPWLQELPDPITKATWDNYVMVSPLYAKENSITSGDIVELSNGSTTVKLPAIVQPGTDKNTVAVALGYGRTVAGKVAKNLGANIYPFVTYNGSFDYAGSYGSVKKTGAHKKLAQTQTHHSMEGRDIIRETTFAEYIKNNKAGNEVSKPPMVQIYPGHKKDGHQWAMAINLASCTGCSSCIISCHAENNVPVVGRKEIANKRDMHWLRIDRYYKGDENQPEVAHMPMLCQHCDNAPCENVCPVMATVQSSDGLNQQVYNRCVGTRYCANNCPYKVRRFNWFNYDRGDDYQKMALNPDVSIRTRGIMEKCTMCIQRIQEGKLTAKRERRDLQDGDIKLACQQSCPADDGILFGDMNDPKSKISQALADERKYTVLEELNVQPRVNYLTKIRNK